MPLLVECRCLPAFPHSRADIRVVAKSPQHKPRLLSACIILQLLASPVHNAVHMLGTPLFAFCPLPIVKWTGLLTRPSTDRCRGLLKTKAGWSKRRAPATKSGFPRGRPSGMTRSRWSGRGGAEGLLHGCNRLFLLHRGTIVFNISESFLLSEFSLAKLLLCREEQTRLNGRACGRTKARLSGALNIGLLKARIRMIRIGREGAVDFLATTVKVIDQSRASNWR